MVQEVVVWEGAHVVEGLVEDQEVGPVEDQEVDLVEDQGAEDVALGL